MLNKAIVAGDLHLRDSIPRCIKVEYKEWIGFQIQQVEFLFIQARLHKAGLVLTGDLFHVPIANSYYLLNALFTVFTANNDVPIYMIAGNHDLPFHCMDELDKTSYKLMWSNFCEGGSFDLKLLNFGESYEGDAKFVVTHRPVFKTKKEQPPFMKSQSAEEVLAEFPNAEFVLTGDIHNKFVYEKDGRFVVNPGSMNIQAASMINYKPACYLVNFVEKEVEEILISQGGIVVSDAHLKAEEEREDRVCAFVESVKASGEVTLSFVDNVRSKVAVNDFSPELVKLIDEIIGG